MEKILTVVVPTYNMEKYLDRCLSSLVVDEERMTMLEVLVVNDGSKDRSSEIAHGYEAKYPGTFKVIDKENGNYGSCMNVGLSFATGKYFKTLDSDDWYDSGAFEEFISTLALSDEDLILTSRYDFYDVSGKAVYINIKDYLPVDGTITDLDSVPQRTSPNEFLCVQNICYKTSVLLEAKMKWPEHVFYTDAIYDYWPLRSVENIRVLDLGVYVYFKGRNDQSMSIASVKKNGKSLFVVAKEILSDYIHLDMSRHANTVDSFVFCCVKYIYDRLLLVCGRDCDDYIKTLDGIMYDTRLYDSLGKSCVIGHMAYLKSFRRSALKIRLLFSRIRLHISLVRQRYK